MSSFLKLLRLRLWILRNVLLRYKGSWFKVLVIFFFSLSFLLGMFFLFREGFQFLKTIPLISELVINRLFYFLFLFTFFLMLFSAILTSYSTFFSRGETDLLISLPLSFRVIFVYKFIEITFYTSWSFIFLGIPFFSAYAVINHLPASFYAVMAVLVIPFVLLSSGLGALFTLLLSRMMALRGWRIYIAGIFIASIPIFYFLYKIFSLPPLPSDLFSVVKQVFSHFQLSQHAYLPSYWVAKGLFLFLKGEIGKMNRYILLLYSSSFLLFGLLLLLSGFLYFPAFSNVRGSLREKRISGNFSPLSLLISLFSFLPRKYRALVQKDIKNFFRDPRQWSQFLIFFGILGVYIINLRSYRYFTVTPSFKMMISLVNIAAMGFILSTLTTRFMFPQMSLEGKRIWIIKLSSLTLREVLWEKFYITFSFCFFVVALLSNLTNILLQVSPLLYLVGNIMVLCMSLSLTSLSVGLGAVFPDFSSDNPAKIVSGFGGTVNFILGIIYVLLVVSLISIPFSLRYILIKINDRVFIVLVRLALIWISGITFLSVFFPLRYACKKLERLEI
ncbi:MAG: hypothetical protein GXO71_04220 [Caldiserica bacterium]|nr:hypothetical protein [Caldisericota bacterium]